MKTENQIINLNSLNESVKSDNSVTEKVYGIKKWSLLILLLTFNFMLSAQDKTQKKNGNRLTVSVLNIDSKGLGVDPAQMGNIVRIELEKLDSFEVMDRYDVSYVVEKNKLNINNCYGKICLVEIGSMINSDKMFTGSVELLGETVVATFRLIDVKSATIEKTQVNEYLNLPRDLQSMVKISIRQMFGKPVEETLMNYLTKRNNFESSINNPDQPRVNLGGPRSGFAYFTGESAHILKKPRNEGGYGTFPLMFQFGYQFEVQYLNEGNYQALFEFLPTVTGFNQNVFIPSVTIMNGFRNNKHGWEIAFGPTFGLINKANGYYDDNQKWHLENEWSDSANPNPYQIEKHVDSRGSYELKAGFIVAAGKTFKSGKLNIPVNIYIIPNKEGIQMGASFGFNARRR